MTRSFRLLAVLGLAVSIGVLPPAGVHAAVEVGRTAAVNPAAHATPPGGEQRLLVIGDDVVFEERIVTSATGQTQILFRDQSSLTLGPNAEVVLDRYVYDPQRSTGEMAVSITKGVFRYIGGKIGASSGVTIRTPTATIGIRGSVLVGNSDPFDVVYVDGRSLEVGNEFGSLRYTRGGRRIVVPGPRVAPEDAGTPPTDLVQRFHALLEGRGGGGLPFQPDDILVQRGLGDPPEPGDLPGPLGFQPGAPQGSGSNVDREVSGSNQTTATDTLQPSPAPDQPHPPPGGPIVGRMLSTPPSAYTTDFGNSSGNPGFHDFVGGPTPGYDLAVTGGTVTDGVFTATAAGGGQVILPVRDGLFAFTADEVTTPFGAADGHGFADPHGWFMVWGFDLTPLPGSDFVLTIAGQPTADGGNLPSTLQVTAYELTQDPTEPPKIPFVDHAISDAFPLAPTGEFYLLRKSSGTIADAGSAPGGERSRTLWATVAIDGQGADQSSLFVLSAGTLKLSDDKLTIAQAVRGSARLFADGKPIQLFATIGTIPDANRDQFFGPDLEYFALTNNGFLLADADPDLDFGYAEVNTYEGNATVGAADLIHGTLQLASRVDPPENAGAHRTTRTLNGYASVIGESRVDGTTFPAPYLLVNLGAQPTSVSITTDAAENSVSATFDLQAVLGTDVTVAKVTFGGGGANGGTFIDDRLFGAENSMTIPGSLNGAAGRLGPFSEDGFSSAMVTHDAVGNPSDFMPAGIDLCACEFMQWGYWQSEFRWADATGPNADRVERFHLGTWVAGELPDLAEIPITGTATYLGHIIGNVFSGGEQYIAGGAFQNDWDFATRNGAITITEFDGRNYAGLASASVDNRRDFSGAVTSGDGIAGAVFGSFVKSGADPVAGVMGQALFADTETTGANYRASATFAAGPAPATAH